MTKMRVMVAFEFDDMDPESDKADLIIQAINSECGVMRVAFDAESCWVDDVLSFAED